MDKIKLKQKFAEAVQLQRNDDNLIANVELIRKHLNVSQSNLRAASLQQTLESPLPEGRVGSPLEVPLIIEGVNQINEIQLANLAAEGVQPVVVEKLGGFQTRMRFLQQPKTVVPYFAIIEEYTPTSFLGDYGAGKTLDVFSLLPNEKTTITLKPTAIPLPPKRTPKMFWTALEKAVQMNWRRILRKKPAQAKALQPAVAKPAPAPKALM